ncbi:MAG TPA: hypothetical protein VF868_06280 [Bacteroidia bacterium]|jgi:hypothetical protein
MSTSGKKLAAACLITVTLLSCGKEERSNGELIYRTGRNLEGETMLDRKGSQLKLAESCQDCHGRTGGNFLNRKESIRYKDLSDPSLRDIPYNDSLIFRFLDHELKSDGSRAITRVKWKMNNRDKKDLVNFLKSL